MRARQKIVGSILTVLGFMLSPLSWWNDLLINVPIAVGFAWVISLLHPPAFEASVIVGYWLTNVVGFLLMHKGVQKLMRAGDKQFTRRDVIRDLGISLVYTAGILVLLKLGVLQPFEQYFNR